ncbi:hypothetical protein AFIC_002137 [[Pseudomonas] carboxydohydrogena]|uniref:Uncharacterized protein n=1 Tax=Afipia carboxydohydrogena TaxID=290 RepID=A0ABY8BKX1_AFICR|nr:hypothetical protein [[Pseudomonas] carboxydohydrogena]WEF50593.1 hypothetical protein AFIC_002137 [[Pseudomonas] carboxydohydrogena]
MRRRIRYALIMAAMAFAWTAGHTGPSQAAPQAEATASSTKPLALGKFSKHRKKHIRRHRSSKKHHASASTKDSSRISSKTDKDDDTKIAARGEADAPLPPSVANAHAELTSPPPEQPMVAQNLLPDSSTLTETDKAATAEPAPNGVQITTSDQLNDMDRDAAAAPATPPEPTTVALAQIAQPAIASTGDESAWRSASLIGKIFIAFGVMLTLASAARMLWPQRAT